MGKHKRLVLRRERLRTLVPAQLGRVLGGEPTIDSFNLACNSFDCNTTTNTLTNTTGNTTDTTGNTITNTLIDPMNLTF